jgi:hypothetical protein
MCERQVGSPVHHSIHPALTSTIYRVTLTIYAGVAYLTAVRAIGAFITIYKVNKIVCCFQYYQKLTNISLIQPLYRQFLCRIIAYFCIEVRD